MKKLNHEQIQFVTQTVEGYVQEMQGATKDDIDAAVDAAIDALDCGKSGSTAFSAAIRTANDRIKARRAKGKVIYLIDRIQQHTPALQAG